jgi:hypothetical protein
MPLFKPFIKKLLSAFGYVIFSKNEDYVRSENFYNLVSGYSFRLNQSDSTLNLPDNKLRAKLLGRLLGTSPTQAFEIVGALRKTARLEGDVCEFGVAQGETSALIANEIAAEGKILHLFDSFEGLPAPTAKDQLKDDIFSLGSMAAYKGEMSCPQDMVEGRLAAIRFPTDRYRIHKGFIEDLVRDKTEFPEVVSFAYVDFDFYEPIKLALEFLSGVMCAGGMIIVDDYNFFSTGAKTATDEFVAAANSGHRSFDFRVADSRVGQFATLTKL